MAMPFLVGLMNIVVPQQIGTLDVAFPFYLYSHRHWYHRLIEQQEIFCSLVWMHAGMLLAH